ANPVRVRVPPPAPLPSLTFSSLPNTLASSGGMSVGSCTAETQIVARVLHGAQRNRRAAALQPSRHRVRGPHHGAHRQSGRRGGHGALRLPVGGDGQHGPGQFLPSRQAGPNAALAGAGHVHGPKLDGYLRQGLREGFEPPPRRTLADVRGVHHLRAGGPGRPPRAGRAASAAGDRGRSPLVSRSAGPPGSAAGPAQVSIRRSWSPVPGRMRTVALLVVAALLSVSVAAAAQSVGQFFRHDDPRYWWYESHDGTWEIAVPANPIYTVHKTLFGETSLEIPLREGGPYITISSFPGGRAALDRARSAVQQQWQHVLTDTRLTENRTIRTGTGLDAQFIVIQ